LSFCIAHFLLGTTQKTESGFDRNLRVLRASQMSPVVAIWGVCGVEAAYFF
jgi:hypothetical protein